MHKLLAVVAALSCWLGAACFAKDKPDTISPDEKVLVEGNTEFAIDLYKQLAQRESNLIFSPYSISTALAMTYAGARGETAEQMVKVLHFKLTEERMHPAWTNLSQRLQKDGTNGSPTILVANALWAQHGFAFRKEFLQLTQHHYHAELRHVDFARNSEDARQTINRWVAERTRDKIQELLKPGILEDTSRLVLTNAIYFKADWPLPFDKDKTKLEQFLISAKEQVAVPMMHERYKRPYPYFEGDNVQLLILPYKNSKLGLVLILPKQLDGLRELAHSLTMAQLNKWIDKCRVHNVDLTLPKFKMKAKSHLKTDLGQMGMTRLFTEKADLTGLSTESPMKLSEVVHEACMVVDEQGTEAAAATAVVAVQTTSLDMTPSASFRADHPFLFLIRDFSTGSTLFCGRLVKP
jgi:serpin B